MSEPANGQPDALAALLAGLEPSDSWMLPCPPGAPEVTDKVIQALLPLLRLDPNGMPGRQQQLSAAQLAPAPVVDSVIHAGSRDSTLTSLAGSMRRRGMAADEIEAALLVVNSRRCAPPLPPGVVARIARSVSRYAAGSVAVSQPDSLATGAAPVVGQHGAPQGIVDDQDAAVSQLLSRAVLVDGPLLSRSDPPVIDWVWNDYLAPGTLNVLHGDGGSGKSILALALACMVSRGSEFLERPTRAGGASVLMLDAEQSLDEVHRRVHLVGVVEADWARLSYAMVSAPILGLPFWQEALRVMVSTARADLVVIDSQRASWAGDEREQLEVGLLLRELARLAEAMETCLLVIHHDTKEGRYSGSSDINAAVSGSRLHLRRVDRNDPLYTTRRVLEHEKCRVGAEQGGQAFSIDVVGLDKPQLSLVTTVSTEREMQLIYNAQDMITWIDASFDGRAQIKDIREHFQIDKNTWVRHIRQSLYGLGCAPETDRVGHTQWHYIVTPMRRSRTGMLPIVEFEHEDRGDQSAE